MGGFDTVIFEKTGPIAYVTLNRPKALNAYNIRMRDELYEILGAIRDDPDVAVAVFKASGANAFCAGADLSEFSHGPVPAGCPKGALGARYLGALPVNTPAADCRASRIRPGIGA